MSELTIKNVREFMARIGDNFSERTTEDDRFVKLSEIIERLPALHPTPAAVAYIRKKFFKDHNFDKQDFTAIYKAVQSCYQKKLLKENEEKRREDTLRKIEGVKTSLKEIHGLHSKITSTTGDLIDVILASMISVRVSKVNHLPLDWLIVIANPSHDKTEHVMAASTAPEIEAIDSFTPAAFASGFTDPKTGEKRDDDFLKNLDGRCLVIKDFSTMLSKKSEVVGGIIGEFTAIYDGTYYKQTGTVGKVGDKSSFSLVAAVTPLAVERHQRYLSMFGPRFFMFHLEGCSEEEIKQGFDKLSDKETPAKKEEFKLKVSAFLHSLFKKPDSYFRETGLDRWQPHLEMLAEFQACLRCYFGKRQDRENDEWYVQKQREEPFRAFLQLRTWLQSIRVVCEREEPNEDDLRLLTRIVMSSGPLHRVVALTLFQSKDDKPVILTASDLSNHLSLSHTRAYDLLKEMTEIGLLDEAKPDGLNGTLIKNHTYSVKEKFQKLFTGQKMVFPQPQELQGVSLSPKVGT